MGWIPGSWGHVNVYILAMPGGASGGDGLALLVGWILKEVLRALSAEKRIP